MMLYELDEVEKEVLMRGIHRWRQFTIRITIKINQGSFGIKYDRQGDFTFCAQSADDARAIAGHHVKGAMSTIHTTRMVEVVGSIPVN